MEDNVWIYSKNCEFLAMLIADRLGKIVPFRELDLRTALCKLQHGQYINAEEATGIIDMLIDWLISSTDNNENGCGIFPINKIDDKLNRKYGSHLSTPVYPVEVKS